jgi:hypothetical protein
MIVLCQDIQHGQFVIHGCLSQKGIEDCDVLDSHVPPPEDRIQEMDRDTTMLGRSQHQFECQIDSCDDSDRHRFIDPFQWIE